MNDVNDRPPKRGRLEITELHLPSPSPPPPPLQLPQPPAPYATYLDQEGRKYYSNGSSSTYDINNLVYATEAYQQQLQNYQLQQLAQQQHAQQQHAQQQQQFLLQQQQQQQFQQQLQQLQQQPPPTATQTPISISPSKWKCASCGWSNNPRNEICGGSNGKANGYGCGASHDVFMIEQQQFQQQPTPPPPPPPQPGISPPNGSVKAVDGQTIIETRSVEAPMARRTVSVVVLLMMFL